MEKTIKQSEEKEPVKETKEEETKEEVKEKVSEEVVTEKELPLTGLELDIGFKPATLKDLFPENTFGFE